MVSDDDLRYWKQQYWVYYIGNVEPIYRVSAPSKTNVIYAIFLPTNI